LNPNDYFSRSPHQLETVLGLRQRKKISGDTNKKTAAARRRMATANPINDPQTPTVRSVFGLALFTFTCLSALAVLTPSLASPPAVYKVVRSIPLKAIFGTRSDWTATAYQSLIPADADDIGDNPAKLCFSRPTDKREDCRKITSGQPNDPSFIYNYQTIKRFDIVPLKPGAKAIAFQAEFYGGGSGFAEQVSLWTYDRKGDFFTPALIISTNESGQYKVISTGPLSGYVITADPIWQFGKGETHFSAHQFEITVYRLSAQSYLRVLTYLTSRKYGGEDEGRPSDAIGGEMTRIRSLLKAVGQ